MVITMKISKEKKFACVINSVLLIIHSFLLIMFLLLGAKIMFYVNICSVITYLVCYYIICKINTNTFISIVYLEVWLHMFFAIFTMGWSYGFQLYCFALIPAMFYTEYLKSSSKNNDEPEKTSNYKSIIISVICMFIYIAELIYTNRFEPIYQTENKLLPLIIHCVNSCVLFTFLIAYMSRYTRKVLLNEGFLQNRAEKDQLTGIHNRFYMRDKLNNLDKTQLMNNYWIAILDIDDFKKINDTYGHNCGDYVLRKLSSLITENMSGSENCRWGGEEFLFLSNEKNYLELLNNFRKLIETTQFKYNNAQISVSATIGVAIFEDYMTNIDDWIKLADDNLYEGKQTGKNRVVCNMKKYK